MRMPTHWWRLGAADQLNDLMGTGIDFIWTGTPAYSVCKHGSGVYSENNANYLSVAEGGIFTPNNFSLRCYMKSTVWNSISGNPSDGLPHVIWEWYKGANDRIIVLFDSGLGGLQIANKISGGWNYFTVTDAALSFTAGDILHLGFNQNRSGINGGVNIRQIYRDSSLIASSVVAIANEALTLGIYRLLGIAGAWYFKGTVDNIYLYNHDNTDYSMYSSERDNLNDHVGVV